MPGLTTPIKCREEQRVQSYTFVDVSFTGTASSTNLLRAYFEQYPTASPVIDVTRKNDGSRSAVGIIPTGLSSLEALYARPWHMARAAVLAGGSSLTVGCYFPRGSVELRPTDEQGLKKLTEACRASGLTLEGMVLMNENEHRYISSKSEGRHSRWLSYCRRSKKGTPERIKGTFFEKEIRKIYDVAKRSTLYEVEEIIGIADALEEIGPVMDVLENLAEETTYQERLEALQDYAIKIDEDELLDLIRDYARQAAKPYGMLRALVDLLD